MSLFYYFNLFPQFEQTLALALTFVPQFPQNFPDLTFVSVSVFFAGWEFFCSPRVGSYSSLPNPKIQNPTAETKINNNGKAEDLLNFFDNEIYANISNTNKIILCV